MYLEGRKLDGANAHAAGRTLLKRMYSRYVGGELPKIAVTERGKPYFVDSPWHFSISHSKAHIFCALSERNIGIDGEEMDRKVNLKLAEKILSPKEKAQFDAAADQRLALLRFWVLKEARSKLTGEGIKGYPNDTEFTLPDPRIREMLGCLVAVMEDENDAI